MMMVQNQTHLEMRFPLHLLSTSDEQSTPARKKKPVTKNTTDQRSEGIYLMIKSVHRDRRERRSVQSDDFDILGELVARKLRNLPTCYAQITLEH